MKKLSSILDKPWKQVFISFLIAVIIHYIMGQPHLLNTIIKDNVANGFLEIVAQVLVGILAIVFSISILAIEIYADKYSSIILSTWAKAKPTHNTLGILLFCVLVFVIAIGLDTVPMSHLGFLATNAIFTFCLLMTYNYFLWVLKLLDPKNLVDWADKGGIKGAQLLGKLGISMLKQNEETTHQCLTKLENLYCESNIPKSNHPIKQITSMRLSVPYEILTQYSAIFEAAIEINNNSVAEHTVRSVFKILSSTQVENDKYDLALQWLYRISIRIIEHQKRELWKSVIRVLRQTYTDGDIVAFRNVFFESGRYAFCQDRLEYVKDLFEYDTFVFNARHLTLRPDIASWNECQTQYYLICLAFSIRNPQNLWYPQPDGSEDYNSFLKYLPIFTSQVLKIYDEVLSQRREWNHIFNDNFVEALNEAKDWIVKISQYDENRKNYTHSNNHVIKSFHGNKIIGCSSEKLSYFE